MPLPAWFTNLAKRAHSRAFDLPPVARAATVGLLTTLLPCGWLYAFVITAAGTGSFIWGAVAMGAFWMGTLPMMAGIGLGAQTLAGPLRRHLPLATSVLLVAAGVWTIFGRMAIAGVAIDAKTPAGMAQAVDSVSHADEKCPLCRSKAK
jgi:sulfite exporter TauE/SafE